MRKIKDRNALLKRLARLRGSGGLCRCETRVSLVRKGGKGRECVREGQI